MHRTDRTARAGEPAVSVTGLTRTFGDLTALDALSFDVAAGELFGIVGPDGAGKTTTLRMLAGVLRPTAGDATVVGTSVAQDPEGVKHRIAYMSQRFGLYGDLTVRENIEFYADLYGVPRKAPREAPRASVRVLAARPVREAARGGALGRNEAEALVMLRADPRARSPAAGRADVRRRPDLAARAVAHPARDGRERHDGHRLDGLPRRSRAVRPRRAAQQGEARGARHAGGAAGQAARPHHRRRLRRTASGDGAACARSPAFGAPPCSANRCTSRSIRPGRNPSCTHCSSAAGSPCEACSELEPSLEDVFIDLSASDDHAN